MIDLKVSEMEKKENSQVSVLNDTPNYPYGLRLNIDPETYKKLGLSIPKVGEKIKIEAMAEVVSVHAENYKGDEKEYCCGLQITEMEVEQLKPEKTAAEAIYGDD